MVPPPISFHSFISIFFPTNFYFCKWAKPHSVLVSIIYLNKYLLLYFQSFIYDDFFKRGFKAFIFFLWLTLSDLQRECQVSGPFLLLFYVPLGLSLPLALKRKKKCILILVGESPLRTPAFFLPLFESRVVLIILVNTVGKTKQSKKRKKMYLL